MKNEFQQEDMKIKCDIRNEIENMQYRFDDILIARQAISVMENDIKDKKMIDPECAMKHLGSAEDFILATQTLETIRDKIKGEFKNYILGEYQKKDKEPVNVAITESHKIRSLLDKAYMDTSYRMMLLMGEAKKSGLTVWDREIRTGHIVEYREAVKLMRKADKFGVFKGINSEDDEYAKINFRKEEGGYEMCFTISSRIEDKQGKGIISLKREINRFMEDVTGEEQSLELTPVSFHRIGVSIDSHDYEFLVKEGVEKSLSNKKMKKINNFLGRHNMEKQEDSEIA